MNIRNHTTLVGVFPVVSHRTETWRSAFGLRMTEFAGRFTLPFEAKWGEVILTEGDYFMHYGTLGQDTYFVEILGKNPGSPCGIFLVAQQGPSSVVQNALICNWSGERQVIRALELPAIGKSVSFAVPKARKLTENRRNCIEMQFASASI